MIDGSLLFERVHKINDAISVVIPSVGDIIENSESYYSVVSAITSMPIDVIAQLDSIGIDFTSIDEYELFLLMFPSLKASDTSLVFGDLDLSHFSPAINEENNEIVLLDTEHDIKIDREIHRRIANVLRKINRIDKDTRKPGNDQAKAYMIERAKIKAKRKHHKAGVSQLESLIVAMVNTEQYKYDFEGTRELSIYQFNECVRQVIKKVDYDNRMYGVYAGTIDVKGLSQDDMNWLIHK